MTDYVVFVGAVIAIATLIICVARGTRHQSKGYYQRAQDSAKRVLDTKRTRRSRCPRNVCARPGASCPLECVEQPFVIYITDGSQIHRYENFDIHFDARGNVCDMMVSGKTWY